MPRRYSRTLTTAATAVTATALAACGSVDNSSSGKSAAKATSKAAVSASVAKVRAFDRAGAAPAKKYRIAYLTECVNNVYCEARLRGVKDAAKKYGFTFKTFDPNFNPAAQLKLVQNAVAEGGYDGFLFAPAAGQPGCSMYKRFLKPTGKPVVSLDLPMCGDADYTPGLDGTVSIQRQDYFNRVLEHAYASCSGTCRAVTFSGFTGSDLFNFWVKASQRAAKLHPNVKVIQDYPAQFDPQLGRQKMQDALQAHPNINLVVSHDDAMSKGVSAAIRAAGKKPGRDVRIYSNGAGRLGLAAVRSGEFNETTVELPYEESYYAAVALVMAMEGKPVKGYITEEQLPRVTDGPGTIYITKKNVDKFKPNW